MSTADETQLLMRASEQRLAVVQRAFYEQVTTGMSMTWTGLRVVSSQRARKLRRRGEAVWFSGRTSTGRAVYAWFSTRIVNPWKRS